MSKKSTSRLLQVKLKGEWKLKTANDKLRVINNSNSDDITIIEISTKDGLSEEFELESAGNLSSKTPVEIGFNLYPNPANEFVNISFRENLSHIYLEILDIQGKKLKSFFVKNTKSISLDTIDLQCGTYIINILSQGSKLSVKFIKN